jgi:hypothetical protein
MDTTIQNVRKIMLGFREHLLRKIRNIRFQILQVSNFVHINAILYTAPKESIRRCQVGPPRLPQNLTTPANPTSRKWCTILNWGVRECNGTRRRSHVAPREIGWRNVKVQHSVSCLWCIRRQSLSKPYHYFSVF